MPIMKLATPYYLIQEAKLLKNLKIIKAIRSSCGAKSVLALKCFSTWPVFNLMKKYMDGTTSSSLNEVRLGKEKFKKEVHAYSVAFSLQEIKEIRLYADKVIFNSLSQLRHLHKYVSGLAIGLRVNPGVSFSHFDLADPSRKFSRLGVVRKKDIAKAMPLISGLMFHFNCENNDFKNFASNLKVIASCYGELFRDLEWVTLGGGIYFTGKDYPVKKFSKLLKDFADRFKVQVYLEPGETAITQSAELVTKVLDIVHNKIDIAIVDSSTEAHMLDLLVYRTQAKVDTVPNGRLKYMIAGRSCLAGDIFGTYHFKSPLKVGSIVRIKDAAGYTMVKKNWFNGLSMPSIVVKRLDGSMQVVRRFNYKDFLNSLG